MTTPTQRLLSWQQAEDSSYFGWSSLLASLLIGLLVVGGFFTPTKTLLELIKQGEVIEIAPPQLVEQNPPMEIELVPPPPPSDQPEFVVPIEVPPPPPKVEELTETPPPPVEAPVPAVTPEPIAAPAPTTTPVAVTPPDPSPPAVASTPTISSPPTLNETPTASPPAQQYAAEDLSIGDKDFPVPAYPYEARLRKIQGTVQVSIAVINGQIDHLEVVGSSGHAILDRSTVDWIRRRWKFPENLTRTLTSPPIRYQLAQLN